VAGQQAKEGGMAAAASRVSFARLTDGCSVAYATMGSGSPLVMVPGWLSHLELNWNHPAARSARARFAAAHRFVWYDRLGCGLSDRDGFTLSLENDVAQLVAVLDAAGIERASLIGYSFGAPPAAVFAARYPHRVDRLVFYSGFARGKAMMPAESLQAVTQLIRADWDMATQLLATRLLPNASSRDLRWFGRFQQVAADPAMAARLLEHTWSMDTRAVLPEITAPTLVVHNRDDQAIPCPAGEEIAALVPGAGLHLLDGNEHDPFIRDSGSVVESILAFVNGRPIVRSSPPAPPEPDLSAREQDVLRLVASGATNDRIAATLGVSVKTVERHVTSVYRKIGAGGRADATRCAVAMGLV
jgi:pimeloyl-ACP methyl ester carboxylesterase/DNA-binding CsgD family transcriptional regulator